MTIVDSQCKRHTGRTTRLLHDAMRGLLQGKPVYVITAHSQQRRQLSDALHEMLKMTRIDRPSFVVETVDCPDLDWPTLTMRKDRSAVVLVDHYAIETYFHKLLTMCVKYDVEMPPRSVEGEE